MNDNTINWPERLSLSQLAELTGFSSRSIRFYIQKELVDKPEGQKRGAYYQQRHIEQLMFLKRGQEQGLSLDRLRQLMRRPESFVPVEPPQPGTMRLLNHLTLAEGIELVIEPQLSGLNADEIRQLTKACLAAIKQLKGDDSHE